MWRQCVDFVWWLARLYPRQRVPWSSVVNNQIERDNYICELVYFYRQVHKTHANKHKINNSPTKQGLCFGNGYISFVAGIAINSVILTKEQHI